jgi:hypothetical protein
MSAEIASLSEATARRWGARSVMVAMARNDAPRRGAR